MKTASLFIFTIVTAFAHAQQLQNPGFEDWTVTDTSFDNQLVYTAANWYGGARTTDSYSGSYAATVLPYASCGIMQNWMVYGAVDPNHFSFWMQEPDFTGSGAPIGFKPAAISGYFKFQSPDTTDEAYGIVILKKQSVEIGHGEITFTPTNDYTFFSIAVSDLQPGITPDSIVVAFSSGMGYFWDGETNALSVGTLYIDQMRTNNPLAGLNAPQLMDCSFFPNPTGGMLNYTFHTVADDEFFLELTDASGKQLLLQRTQPESQQTADLTGLAAGNYHVFIKGSAGIYAERLIVKSE